MKKVKYLLFIFLISFFNILNVNAFSITGATSTTVGSSIAVKIEASGLIGRFDVSTSNASVLSGGKSIWLENNSTTLYFSANKIGTATITVNATDVSDESGNAFTGKRILYVTVKEKSSKPGNNKPSVDVNKKYNSNNYLKSLSIEGYELTPVFNKDTLEYNVNLAVDTTKINILATTEDKTATIKGVGEISVNDGPNTIIVTVTAENGNERQYKINATVQEPDPIEVKVDNEKYTIVRKKGQIENIPVTFIEDKITVENQEVVAYKSETAKLTLLALKDSKGDIKLFIYNSANKKFSMFNAANSSANLVILNKAGKKVPKDFIKDNIKINDNNVTAYKYRYDKDNNYYLVYAKNLETANESFYLYDKKEGTYQRYYDNLLDTKDLHIKYLLYISICLIILFILILLIKLLVKMLLSKEKKISKYQKKIDKLKKDTKSNLYEEDRVSIEKIDKDDYVTPKKSRKERLNELKEARKKLDQNKTKYRRISLEEDDFDE